MVVALVRRPAHRRHLRQLLGDLVTVAFCTEVGELAPLVGKRPVRALVIEAGEGGGVDEEVDAIRRRFPSVPVLVYCGAAPAAARAAEEALAAVAPALPPAIAPIVAWAVRHAATATTVSAMAAALGVHRRTLVNRLAAAGWPAPRELLAWGRLLVAARLLDGGDRTVASAAAAAGFGSGAALRGMLRRRVGLTPGELRRRGGVVHLVALLRERLRPPDAPRPSRRPLQRLIQ